jgi:ABC-type transporter Mla subunit MlaD
VVKHQHASAAIEKDDVIPGKIAPPAFLAQAGFGAEQAGQLRSVLAAVESGVTKVGGLVDRTGPEFEAAITDVRQIARDLRGEMAGWTAKIDATLKNVEGASGKLDPLLVKVDKGIDSATTSIADLRAIITDNRASLNSILKSLASAAEKIDQTTVDEVNGAIKTADAALGKFTATLDRVNTITADAAPTIRNMLANANLAAEQVKLVAIEVRSQPWRLLVQPDKRELETELLYDATRSYAEAATQLRTLSESLQSVTAAGANKEAVAALTEQLVASMATFRKAEEAFLDRLIGKQKK